MSKSKSLRCTYVKLNIRTHMHIADEYIHFETNDSNCFISGNSLEAYTTVFLKNFFYLKIAWRTAERYASYQCSWIDFFVDVFKSPDRLDALRFGFNTDLSH